MWRKRWRMVTAMALLSLSAGCLSFERSKVVYLPSDEKPVFLNAGEAVPFDGVCLQRGTYQKLFEGCADRVLDATMSSP